MKKLNNDKQSSFVFDDAKVRAIFFMHKSIQRISRFFQ